MKKKLVMLVVIFFIVPSNAMQPAPTPKNNFRPLIEIISEVPHKTEHVNEHCCSLKTRDNITKCFINVGIPSAILTAVLIIVVVSILS